MIKLSEPSKNWQKICCAEDYCHPDFKIVIEKVLKNLPSYHRKQWEFVVIYLNLLKLGKLNKNAKGASFGAGREPLIYIISEAVKSFLATDLYVYDTGWSTAQKEEGVSCLDFVLGKAPANFNAAGLTVKEMDMRYLDIADNSLDFCYSSCAFEHIGHKDDFVQHLKEVKRVLKDDGVYVFTTEHLFLHETMKVKGNYKFNQEYLFDLFTEANFYPDEVFDNSLPLSHLNKPRPELEALNNFTFEMLNLFPGLILAKRGVPYTSSCFVLRKTNKKNPLTSNVETQDKEQQFITSQISNSIKTIYSKYRELDCFYSLKKETKQVLYDHLEYLVDNESESNQSKALVNGNIAFTEFIYFYDFDFSFVINLSLEQPQKLKFRLVEINQVNPKERKVLKVLDLQCNENQQVKFDHKALPNKAYAISVFVKNKNQIPMVKLSIAAKVRVS